jgi:hypothetical protein
MENKTYTVGTVKARAFEPSDSVVQKSAEVTISSDEIVGTAAGDLGHADGVVLVAAPGAGKTLQFVSGILIYDYAGAAYTGGAGDDLVVSQGTTAVSASIATADLITATADKIIQLEPLSADVTLTENSTLNLSSTAVTKPGVAEVFTLQLTVAEDTGGSCELTLNGVTYDIPLTADTVNVNAGEIKAYIDANVTTHTATVATDTVTVTSVTLGAETDATYAAGTCNSTAGTVIVTVAGVDDATGVIRAKIMYNEITTGL